MDFSPKKIDFFVKKWTWLVEIELILWKMDYSSQKRSFNVKEFTFSQITD